MWVCVVLYSQIEILCVQCHQSASVYQVLLCKLPPDTEILLNSDPDEVGYYPDVDPSVCPRVHQILLLNQFYPFSYPTHIIQDLEYFDVSLIDFLRFEICMKLTHIFQSLLYRNVNNVAANECLYFT